jgi:hypothetical protein
MRHLPSSEGALPHNKMVFSVISPRTRYGVAPHRGEKNHHNSAITAVFFGSHPATDGNSALVDPPATRINFCRLLRPGCGLHPVPKTPS